MLARELVEAVLGKQAVVEAEFPRRRAAGPRVRGAVPLPGARQARLVRHRRRLRHDQRRYRHRAHRAGLRRRGHARGARERPADRERGRPARSLHRRGRRPGRGRSSRTPTPPSSPTSRSVAFCSAPSAYTHSYPFCWRCDTPLLYYAKSTWFVRTTAVKDAAPASQRGRHVVSRAHQARALRRLAREQHRLGALARPLLGHAAAHLALRAGAHALRRLAWKSCASWRRGRCLTSWSCTGPTSTMSSSPAPSAAARCAASRRSSTPGSTRAPCPSAQWHYPFENERHLPRALPGRLHRRGHRPDPRLVLQPAGHRHPGRGPQLVQAGALPGAHPRRRRPEDEQEPRQRGRARRRPGPAGRRRLPLVPLHGLEPVVPAALLASRWSTRWCASSCSPCGTPTASSRSTRTSTASTRRRRRCRSPSGRCWTAGLSASSTRWCRRVTEGLEDYDATNSGRAIQDFVDDLSNWYVRRSRRRFWKSESDSDKLAAYQTLHEALVTVAKLLAPYAPFVPRRSTRTWCARSTRTRPRACTCARGRRSMRRRSTRRVASRWRRRAGRSRWAGPPATRPP